LRHPGCGCVAVAATAVLGVALASWRISLTLTRPSAADFPGVYVGSYYGGAEVFDVREDRTFTQTFVRHGEIVYKSSGTWEIEGDYVCFRPFVGFDERRGGEIQRLAGIWASWVYAPGRIWLSHHDGYQAEKQREQP
jgi:hypothetical protein